MSSRNQLPPPHLLPHQRHQQNPHIRHPRFPQQQFMNRPRHPEQRFPRHQQGPQIVSPINVNLQPQIIGQPVRAYLFSHFNLTIYVTFLHVC